jgi:hypothetical protein
MAESAKPRRIPTRYSPEFALTNEAVAEVRIERKIVGTEEGRELELVRRRKMPDIREGSGVKLKPTSRSVKFPPCLVIANSLEFQ